MNMGRKLKKRRRETQAPDVTGMMRKHLRREKKGKKSREKKEKG